MKRRKDPDHENDDEGDDWDPDQLGALPKALQKRPSWKDFEKLLGLNAKRKTAAAPAAQIAKAVKAAGLPPFPASYLEYLGHFGHVGEWRLAYKHKRFPIFLGVWPPARLKDGRATFTMRLDARLDWDEAHAAVSQKLRSLIPFGSNAGRRDICWDPSQKAEKGELAICFVDRDASWKTVKDARLDVGAHLLDVLKYYEPKDA